jgi:hypothetical protein
MHKNPFFIVTHKPIPWIIPFNHRVIGVEGFKPDLTSGISAADVISKSLDSETAFGALRSNMAVNIELAEYADDASVFLGNYRLFLSSEFSDNWLDTSMMNNRIISPDELSINWSNIIATEIPAGVDILIPAPKSMPHSVMGQYMGNHHLDDLLFGVGCAIRSGLLDPTSIPQMLLSTTLIPYGNFAAKKSIRVEFNQRIWSCALDFYKNYYIPRSAYQRRVIDFVFERIASMAIVQMVTKFKLNCVSCRSILVSTDGNYSISQ